MFYKMIENKCKEWYHSNSCTVRDLIQYMEKTGQLRDAQIEAIKVYLFLKIHCACQPLDRLFCQGYFNSLNLDEYERELSQSTLRYLKSHPAAAALYEYALLRDEHDQQVSQALEETIRKIPEQIDYDSFFHQVFYKSSYADYLFSLPMGAGKTYLMAAFIYLDLYFAMNEPQNPAFAHNFIIFAPSGLKSSVVPSLKTIRKFDPSWVIPEPAASRVKRAMSFEVLDQAKSASKSNKTKNPNVQKIATHQPLSELFGLVAVINAEKVILDRLPEKNGQIDMFAEMDAGDGKQANELRHLIGRLPKLSIFIDEVHHAVRDEIKLRAVINHWAEQGAINAVVGFSGTPYLEKAEKIAVTDQLSIATAEITNIVYYYPLINGVGNFLKRPMIKIANLPESERIIENGVRAFLDVYRDTVYQNGTTAKLGIYCGTIEKLETQVLPLVSRIAAEYSLPGDAILRFHKGNKQFPQPTDSQMAFDLLDDPTSRIRIVLLVQIGKEGWDCRSLTGIILSQEGDCPKNMVLQTSCRCLRQVDRGQPETAMIYLNPTNAAKLSEQLRQQQHISLKEFGDGGAALDTIKRYNRMEHLRLPKVAFYQLKVSYSEVLTAAANPAEDILRACEGAELTGDTSTTDLTMRILSRDLDEKEYGHAPAAFDVWLYGLTRSSFGTLTMARLLQYRDSLKQIFDRMTYQEDNRTYFSSHFNRSIIEANIRKAFCDKQSLVTREELVPEEAALLNIAHFKPIQKTSTPQSYYPDQHTVEKIILDDQGLLEHDPGIEEAIRQMEQAGHHDLAATLRARNASHPQKDKSFHYLPYHTDSSFEQAFMTEMLPFLDGPSVKPLGLELYYNGDRAMTEFQIRCYRSKNDKWQYIGLYTPDFLLIQRKDGKIYKVIMIETKGRLYAHDPNFQERRAFTETAFIQQNNAAFGYERFEYLYLEDTLSEEERLQKTKAKVKDFFEEGSRYAD